MVRAGKSENFIGFKFQEIEDALCDEDEIMDERLASIEDVLCEFDEMLNGGNENE